MAANTECPKCGGRMSPGIILDITYGSSGVASWLAGPVEKSRWTGVGLRGKAPIELETWRCGRCGFLESYAPPARS